MRILISGGSGLIGSEVTKQLLAKGHQVAHLSRSPSTSSSNIIQFEWDIEKGVIAQAASDWQAEGIINLAGAPINKRWTPQYKSEIISSRVDGTHLLYEWVQKEQIPLKVFVSASAVGYYPNSLEDSFKESASAGSDFLSEVCVAWEREANLFKKIGIRTAICRVGIVLANKGGALPEIAKPIRYGVGAPLGSGKQWMPWIHLKDVAKVFVKAVEDDGYQNAINAVGPYNVSNASLTKATAKVLKRPLWLPNIPAVALKLVLGEMAATALSSNKVENAKLQALNFEYSFTTLEAALNDLLK